jgi:hypothetical protein
MGTTFRQLPATMNLLIKSGDTVSTDVEFGTNLTGHAVSSHLYSLVDHREIYEIPTQVTNVTAGKVQMTFLAPPPAGTYGWKHQWVQSGDITRTVLSGVVDILK